MPVIPYPNPVKALHQVSRHEVERRPGWEPLVVRSADGEIVISEWVSSLTDLARISPRLAEWTEMVRSAKHILPRPRTSSDG